MEGIIVNFKKRIASLALVGIMTLSIGTTSFASPSHHENIGVSLNPPIESNITPFGLGKPNKKNVVNLNDSELTFSGKANVSTLYSNSYFKGKSTISYSITNDSDSRLTVKFYTSNGWFKSKDIIVEANATLEGTVDGFKKDTLYYLTFSAPSDCSGKIY